MTSRRTSASSLKSEVGSNKNSSVNKAGSNRGTDTPQIAMGTGASIQKSQSPVKIMEVPQIPSGTTAGIQGSRVNDNTKVAHEAGEWPLFSRDDKPKRNSPDRVKLFRQVQLGEVEVDLMGLSNFNANQAGPYGRRLLHLAAESNNAELVRYLVEQGADKEAQDADGWFAEHFAASADADQTLDFLMKCRDKHKVDYVLNTERQTPLMTAAIFDSAKAATVLLRHRGIDPNAVDVDGDTALILAARCGSLKVLEVLVMSKKKSEAGRQNKQGRSALDYAKQRKDAKMVNLLS